MARIAGVDLPREKRVEIGLTYIFGIGLTSSKKILEKTGYRTRMELLIAVAQKNLIIVTPDKALDEDNF